MPAFRDPLDALPPWDAVPYFETVRESVVTVPINTTTQICKPNPNRVALVIGIAASGTTNVGLDPNSTGSSGMALSFNAGGPLKLLFSEVGPLCQQAFYARGTSQVFISVYEILLSKWPTAGANGGRRRASTTKSVNRNGNNG